jgi:multidrug/hemolysin transport system ATP-binding protein
MRKLIFRVGRSRKMDVALDVRELQKSYGQVKAVDGISFRVEKGELFGFLGVNGAGKSTTINMLCTLLAPSGGSARVCGWDLGKDNEKIRRSIGVVYQENGLDRELSVKENLMVRGLLYERDQKRLKRQLEYVSEILEMEDLLSRAYGKLSGGQKRRCEVARALLHQPKLLFLDEPTTGLDPTTRAAVWRSVELLREKTDMTVFLTTHYMEEAAKADHIAIMDAGKVRERGTPFSLKEKFAADMLRLFFSGDQERRKGESCLAQMGKRWNVRQEALVVSLDDSLEALPVLNMLRERHIGLDGFEVVQGTMDDVFLHVTGKELEEK